MSASENLFPPKEVVSAITDWDTEPLLLLLELELLVKAGASVTLLGASCEDVAAGGREDSVCLDDSAGLAELAGFDSDGLASVLA